MLNEFVYCPRLFYLEHVEGAFLHSDDTVKGGTLHRAVDSGKGELPSPDELDPEETLHSRSVLLGSDRLGVTAKLDLVEQEAGAAIPIDYKLGAPRMDGDSITLWDTDRIQLGLQALLLRDNGYTCDQGIIYYRATKQRVGLDITPDLEAWILGVLEQARLALTAPLPPPLEDSPKCVRCSLAPICLPDEVNLLQQSDISNRTSASEIAQPRRLMAPRSDQRALYLTTPGLRVGKKGEVLQVKEKEKLLQECRLADLDHVALFGNIQISTQAIQTLCEKEIPVTYFSMGGWFYGITRAPSTACIHARIAQFRAADQPARCLELARHSIFGKIRNQRTLLMRNHTEPPPEPILRLKRLARDALACQEIPALLGVEGTAAALYFEHFAGMIKIGDRLDPDRIAEETSAPRDNPWTFDFTHRNRRPPRDPVNAMLSLAYAILAKDCTLALHAAGLDPAMGFYHQVRPGRPSLALDLMEEFRPIIADSVVLTAINNRMVTPADFIRAGHSVNLSPQGRKGFYTAYEQRMNHLIRHPLFDYQVSYRRALEIQARLMAKVFIGDIPAYHPFMTK
jgi:CRISPR-associated protein Cas1